MESRAFTLVELLIVVGIIGLLATIGVAAYKSVGINSRNQWRKSSLTQLQKALELYATDHGGQYPSTSGSWWSASDHWGAAHADSGATGWIPNLAPAYVSILPRDPKFYSVNPNSTNTTCQTVAAESAFLYRSNGTDYKVIANCTPEGTLSASDPFYDPAGAAFRWQISTPGGLSW